jgi:T5SS/PEP-CTERM-associated repeat protein
MKTKSASQTPRKLTKNAILLAIIALALSASSAFAATATWTGGKSSWFNGGNWNPGEPDCSTDAEINNTGTAQINTPTPLAQCHDLTLGADVGDSGNVSVSNGSLSICENAFIAAHDRGNLSIANAGSVTTAGYAAIAAFMGTGEITSDGAATVDGTSTWTITGELDVGGNPNGQGGTGLLTVTNGGTVSSGTSVHVYPSGTLAGTGTVSVNSGSGTVTINGGTLAPSGALTITGNLTFGTTNANMRCNVSSTSVDNAQVSGTGTLNGKLSVTVSVTGDFTLLHLGQGRVNDSKFSSYSFTYTGCLSPSIRYVNGDVILHVESSCQ